MIVKAPTQLWKYKLLHNIGWLSPYYCKLCHIMMLKGKVFVIWGQEQKEMFQGLCLLIFLQTFVSCQKPSNTTYIRKVPSFSGVYMSLSFMPFYLSCPLCLCSLVLLFPVFPISFRNVFVFVRFSASIFQCSHLHGQGGS